MADNLSPLVNLDLINKIYKTINAQIAERVYDPVYYPEATLGSEGNKYVEAYISGNTSTGTLNGLTLAKATAGFTISGGETTSRTLTVADTATINNSLEVTAATSITGSLTVSAATNIIKGLTVGAAKTYTGAVTIQSSGAGNTTIEGPSDGTATFTAPTSDTLGSLQIKSGSHTSTVSVAHGKTISTRSNLTVGEGSNTGDVVIKPKSTYKLTITSDDTKAITATLRDGTCVITDDYAEDNTASKLVKRDSNSNIKVTSVNKLAIDAATTANTNKIGLSKGTASIAVAGAELNVSKNLKVFAATTLGEADTGRITVKSAGAKDTVIIGPNGGAAAQLIGGEYTTSATTENSTAPEENKLLKIKKVDAKTFLAGPESGSKDVPNYRSIKATDLPEASASANGIVTTGSQSFEGAKTFNKTIIGDITGNAGTATKLETARSFKIADADSTNTSAAGVGFDGTEDTKRKTQTWDLY